MKAWVSHIEGKIRLGDIAGAKAALSHPLNLSGDDTVNSLRTAGTFRFARYDFKPECLTEVVDHVLQQRLSEASKSYCESVLALSKLAPEVYSLQKSICRSLNPRSFKSYLVTIDQLFRDQQAVPPTLSVTTRFDNWRDFPREDLADAFSYYCSLLNKHSRLPTIDELNKVNCKRIKSGYYLQQLFNLAIILRFRDAEMVVAYFPFSARTDGHTVTVRPDKDSFEKSVRWGYIRHDQQLKGDFEELRALRSSEAATHPDRPAPPKFEDAVKLFVDRMSDRAFVRVEWPEPRIQLHLPFNNAFKDVFEADGSWLDELHLINVALKGLFITYDDLRKTPIYKSITLHDVIRFQRVSKFACEVFEEYARRARLDRNSPVYLNSIISHLPQATAATIATELCGIERAEELLELLSVQDFKSPFDVLYRPILRHGNEFILPPGLLAYSNVARNCLQASRFRFDSSEAIDPVTDLLVDSFTQEGVKVCARIKYSFKGERGEIDLLVEIDDQLFAFESKNSLHPCNTHELRQSYDYVLKGFEQLGNHRRLFADPDFATYIRAKSGLPIKNPNQLITCVVLGNRMFGGYEGEGHVVRNAYELQNVIRGGTARFSFAKDFQNPAGEHNIYNYKFWKGCRLAASDLIDYLQRDSLHQIAFNSMLPCAQVTRFGRWELHSNSFYLDPLVFADLLKSSLSVEAGVSTPS